MIAENIQMFGRTNKIVLQRIYRDALLRKRWYEAPVRVAPNLPQGVSGARIRRGFVGTTVVHIGAIVFSIAGSKVWF